MVFEILVVCTGNICRSPIAAQLLDADLDGVSVTSAGVAAAVGSDIASGMKEAIGRAGMSAAPHSARQITETLVTRAGLVLTMDTNQRSQVLRLVPAALKRVYTLREFALICEHLRESGELVWPARSDDEWHLLDLAERAGQQRGRFPPGPGIVIDDPYRGTTEDYDRALVEIRAAVDQIVGTVRQGRHSSL